MGSANIHRWRCWKPSCWMEEFLLTLYESKENHYKPKVFGTKKEPYLFWRQIAWLINWPECYHENHFFWIPANVKKFLWVKLWLQAQHKRRSEGWGQGGRKGSFASSTSKEFNKAWWCLLNQHAEGLSILLPSYPNYQMPPTPPSPSNSPIGCAHDSSLEAFQCGPWTTSKSCKKTQVGKEV